MLHAPLQPMLVLYDLDTGPSGQRARSTAGYANCDKATLEVSHRPLRASGPATTERLKRAPGLTFASAPRQFRPHHCRPRQRYPINVQRSYHEPKRPRASSRKQTEILACEAASAQRPQRAEKHLIHQQHSSRHPQPNTNTKLLSSRNSVHAHKRDHIGDQRISHLPLPRLSYCQRVRDTRTSTHRRDIAWEG